MARGECSHTEAFSALSKGSSYLQRPDDMISFQWIQSQLCCWQDLYRPYEESFAESSDGGVAEDTLVVRTVSKIE